MTTKQYNFTLFFNYGFKDKESGLTRDRKWAEEKRDSALVYLTKLFDNKAQFSCIAKDENKVNSFLMLRGYVNLNSPCKQTYAKRLWKVLLLYTFLFWGHG